MATFKHISSKNADYGAAEQYLTFEHDEFTMKPTLDGNGRLVPRDDYRIASLNCDREDFAIACMRSNLKYGKNQKREDVKSHHYIISFDPRDAQDNGLTVDRAQQLGEQFCKEHFPGHQALVCTHPDGHNHSGNIHVHIVINSLRIAEVPLLPYMERPADTREGCKHRCTDAAMEYFKAEVMEMCHRENLYQIDLLHGSKNRITEREYWAKRKGQAALDKENAFLAATGEPPKLTKFETDKEKLRRTIRAALSSAISFEDFSGKLLQQGVTVKESRGRLSYLTPDRTKPITARKLGDDFDRAAVLETLTINAQNAARAAETPAPKQEYPRSIKDRLQRNKAAVNTPKQDSVQRMVGEEAIAGDSASGTPYASIYAPGVNIHRSPFGGRCSEYFSEDPYLSGMMGGAEIRGCQEMGVVCMVKHYAANEQETHRSINGDCSWLTEQSLREIYLKSFELAVKTGESRGLMTSFNRIGTRWTGGDYRLVTEILRDEWGFRGTVICDFNTIPQYMNPRQMFYAGGDLDLATLSTSMWTDCDTSETGDAVVLRQAAKNVLYSFVNSNAMNGEVVGYKTALWRVVMYAADAAVAVIVVAWGAGLALSGKKKKTG